MGLTTERALRGGIAADKPGKTEETECLLNIEGVIGFSLSSKHYSHKQSSRVVYQPKLRDIVLFP